MKDDTSTPTTEGSSPNEFERGKPGTAARDQAEAAIERLRREGGVFVEAVRATRMAMVVTDPTLPGDPIVFANESFLKLSGYRMEEVLGQQPHFLNGAGTDPKDAARFAEALRNDQDDLVETVQYRKSGTRFVATVLLSGFKDAEGRTIHHFLSWLDVTRRVDAEEEVADLLAAQSRLRESEASLRESEERHEFLLKLTDALRPIEDPLEIQATTARMVAEHLRADRSMYAEVEGTAGAERGTVRGQYVRPGGEEAIIVPFPKQFAYGQFGQHTMAARYRGEPLIVADVQTDPKYSEDERAAWAAFGVRAAIVAALAKDGRLVAEFGVHSTTAREWTESEIALVQEAAERTWAEVVRALAEQALRESEEKYAGLFAAAPAPFLILKPDAPHFTIADVNDAYLAATMRTRDDLVGRPMFEAFPDNPDDPAANGVSNLRASLERALAWQQFDLMDVQKYDIVRPDGTFEERWWKPANSPVIDANGSVTAIIHHVADVTAEHRAVEALQASERHSQTLLAELQHRVRNTLAVVRSIARRTAENTESAEDLLGHLQGRLDAFSRVQAALTRNTEGTVDLQSLIEDELIAHAAREGQQLRVHGPAVLLQPREAERLSLAIHELATNAVKHGALTSPKGRIRIDWRAETADGDKRLTFNWTESGVQVDPGRVRDDGFGLELLRHSLPYDLGAETKVEFRRQGLHFELHMPLVTVRSDDD